MGIISIITDIISGIILKAPNCHGMSNSGSYMLHSQCYSITGPEISIKHLQLIASFAVIYIPWITTRPEIPSSGNGNAHIICAAEPPIIAPWHFSTGVGPIIFELVEHEIGTIIGGHVPSAPFLGRYLRQRPNTYLNHRPRFYWYHTRSRYNAHKPDKFTRLAWQHQTISKKKQKQLKGKIFLLMMNLPWLLFESSFPIPYKF